MYRFVKGVVAVFLVGKWFGFSCDEVFDEAMAEFDRGAYEDAIEAFAHCLSDNDVNPATLRLAKFYTAESYSQIGLEYLRDGNPVLALKNLETATEYDANRPYKPLHEAREALLRGDLVACALALQPVAVRSGAYAN